MRLRLVIERERHTLYSIETGSVSLAVYLSQLEENDKAAHAQIMRRLEHLAERGPTRNKQEYHTLGDGLYEAKAMRGPRIVFFYDENQIVICTHGFDKKSKKTPARELKLARNLKKEYLAMKAQDVPFKLILGVTQDVPRRQP